MNVVYHPLAERDVDQAFDYYQEILPSLAEGFIEELDTSIENMINRPLRYRLVKGDVRKCSLKRFPYAIYFALEKDAIRILIIKHNRRHPAYGMDRLDHA